MGCGDVVGVGGGGGGGGGGGWWVFETTKSMGDITDMSKYHNAGEWSMNIKRKNILIYAPHPRIVAF